MNRSAPPASAKKMLSAVARALAGLGAIEELQFIRVVGVRLAWPGRGSQDMQVARLQVRRSVRRFSVRESRG
jgi:hypothetical protein